MDRTLADVRHDHGWCAYGEDRHRVDPIPCRGITGYRLELVGSRFGTARIVEERFPTAEGPGSVTVRWDHGIFGSVHYRLLADVEARLVDGPSLLITRVEFDPNPIPLGSVPACRVTLLNCGSVRIGSSPEQPIADHFILAVPTLWNSAGEVFDFSALGLRPGQYQQEITVNLEPGEETVRDWTASDPIPDSVITRGYVGEYQTRVELQDRRLDYERDLSTRSEPVDIAFV